MAEDLKDTIIQAVKTRHWQRLCVRYANGTDEDRRYIDDLLDAVDRPHFELAWAATYGPKKPLPRSPPRRLWWPRWLRRRHSQIILSELNGAGPD